MWHNSSCGSSRRAALAAPFSSIFSYAQPEGASEVKIRYVENVEVSGYMPHPHDLFDVGWWANNEGLKTVRSAFRFEYHDNHVYLKARWSMDIHVFRRRQDAKHDYFPCSSGAPWESGRRLGRRENRAMRRSHNRAFIPKRQFCRWEKVKRCPFVFLRHSSTATRLHDHRYGPLVRRLHSPH
jgi:hypothetical protein